MNPTYLQLFLIANTFLVGVLATLAVRHAYAHYRPQTHDAERAHPPTPGVRLAPEVKEKLLADAQKNFQKILNDAADQLQFDLGKTSAQLNKRLETLGAQIVDDEMKRYKASLEQLQRNTETAVTSTQETLSQHQESLETKLAEQQKTLEAKLIEDVAAERTRLIELIDSKLADANASFLLETLQHNVDLGAQTAYLTAMLEEHKEDFKREIGDDTKTTS